MFTHLWTGMNNNLENLLYELIPFYDNLVITVGDPFSKGDETNLITTKSSDELSSLKPEETEQIILLINAALISGDQNPEKTSYLNRFSLLPNHYISLQGKISKVDDSWTFPYWTWGQKRNIRVGEDFMDGQYYVYLRCSY